MCGILYVKSIKPRDRAQDLAAAKLMRFRGPDAVHYRWNGNTFLAQTLLHFTGDQKFYAQAIDQGFAFNGEIYNWQQWSVDTDGEVAFNAVRDQDWSQMQSWNGPWAWIYDDGEHVYAATDAAWERHLFQYQDQDWHIICTEIAPILEYVSTNIITKHFSTKHYPIVQNTPWHGIERLRPGGLYKDGAYVLCLDHLNQWRDPDWLDVRTLAIDRMDAILDEVLREMEPKESSTLTISGGLDSGLLKTYLPKSSTITISTDKDPCCHDTGANIIVDCDTKIWADAFVAAQESMRLPMLSWSLPGWWLVMRHSQDRVIFTGCGADEIFGGYPHTRHRTPSPYSDNTSDDPELMRIHRDYPDAYLRDYVIQTGSVDQLGIDLIAGAHGREARNPFMHRRVISFAQSLPRDIRTGAEGKQILRDVYRVRTGQHYVNPKQGFTGHCNDSIKHIVPHYEQSDDRHTAWREFILDYFTEIYG